MKTFSVSKFKAQALAILNRVAQTGEDVLVTKRGKSLARVEACRESRSGPKPGWLAGTITFEEDIVSPLGSGAWESARGSAKRRRTP